MNVKSVKVIRGVVYDLSYTELFSPLDRKELETFGRALQIAERKKGNRLTRNELERLLDFVIK